MPFHVPAEGRVPGLRRTFWVSERLGAVVEIGYGNFETRAREHRHQVKEEREAHFVASRTENGLHAPALDVDMPVEAERLEGGVTRLRFPDLALRPWRWKRLLRSMSSLGLLDPGTSVALTSPPLLELAVPVRVVPSSSSGHFHVYLDVQMPWRDYRRLCRRLMKAGVIGRNFLNLTEQWGMSMLFRPGLTKERIRELSGHHSPLDGY